MALELDHVFICVSSGAPEAEQLIAFGLTEGSASVHPGQGTANRRFFFHNLMLELLWVNDIEAVQSSRTQPTYLWERWSGRDRHACPIGICLRPTNPSNPMDPTQLPFSSWNYYPAYLPPHLPISIATNSAIITEPLLFYIPFGQRQSNYPPDKAEPLQHPVGFREVAQITFATPQAKHLSPALDVLANARLLDIRLAQHYHLTLTFGNKEMEQDHSFEPQLPLTFRW